MLSANDLAFVRAQLNLVAPSFERAITYRAYTSSSGGDATLGVPTAVTYTDTDTAAIVHEMTDEEVKASDGVFKLGDKAFGTRRTAVDARDRIVYQSVTWEPVEIHRAGLAGETFTWWLLCKRA